jgi:hypothetical protein
MPRPVAPVAKALAPEDRARPVVDFFGLLRQPRRPWIDPDQLKNEFLATSSDVHPDKVHGGSDEEKQRAQQQYIELNSAYQTLRQPKERLAHLLELQTGNKPAAIQSAPKQLMDLFLEIGTLCREVDKLIEQKRQTTSPLVRVSFVERGEKLAQKVIALQQLVTKQHDSAENALRDLDRDWQQRSGNQGGSLPLSGLEELYRTFSYLSRWSAQLQERLVQLAL